MCKVHRVFSPEILNDFFPLGQAGQYNLRNRLQFIIPSMKTLNYDFESLKYMPEIYRP